MKVCVFVCRSLTTPPHQPPAPQGSVLTGECLSSVFRLSFSRSIPDAFLLLHTYPLVRLGILVRYSIDIVEEVSMIAEFAISMNIGEGIPR